MTSKKALGASLPLIVLLGILTAIDALSIGRCQSNTNLSPLKVGVNG